MINCENIGAETILTKGGGYVILNDRTSPSLSKKQIAFRRDNAHLT